MWRNPRFVRRTPPTRQLDHAFTGAVRVTGGARVDARQVSAPFALLTFDRDAACLSFRQLGRPPRILQRSPVWILRSEVTTVVRTHGTALRRGIMFAGDPGIFDGVVFWTRDRTGLLDALAARGWPVEAGASRPRHPDR